MTSKLSTDITLSIFISSSAVAKRPRDASCLSVFSFNSTIPQVQFFYYKLLRLRIYQCVQFDSVLLPSAFCPTLLSYTRSPPAWLRIARDCAWYLAWYTAARRSRLVVQYPSVNKKPAAMQTTVQQLSIARSDNHWFQDFSLLHLHLTPQLGGFPSG